MRPTFIETELFSASAAFLTDAELRAAQEHITTTFEAGDLVKGTAGARKIRVKLAGRGKASGARLLYFDDRERCGYVWLLLAFPKSVTVDLSEAGKKALATTIRAIKAAACP